MTMLKQSQSRSTIDDTTSFDEPSVGLTRAKFDRQDRVDLLIEPIGRGSRMTRMKEQSFYSDEEYFSLIATAPMKLNKP
jgi:hypothetical protein